MRFRKRLTVQHRSGVRMTSLRCTNVRRKLWISLPLNHQPMNHRAIVHVSVSPHISITRRHKPNSRSMLWTTCGESTPVCWLRLDNLTYPWRFAVARTTPLFIRGNANKSSFYTIDRVQENSSREYRISRIIRRFTHILWWLSDFICQLFITYTTLRVALAQQSTYNYNRNISAVFMNHFRLIEIVYWKFSLCRQQIIELCVEQKIKWLTAVELSHQFDHTVAYLILP